jgi:hypothetical protein
MIKLNIIDSESKEDVPEHLGGHQGRSHTDIGTLEFLKNEYQIESMVDVGQGPGAMVELAKQSGIDARGVDGDPTVNADVHHDYTSGPLVLDNNVDLAWSVEFLEHVYEEYIPNFMETFKCAKYILCTGAKPGEPGHHHVNCQPAHYWISKFAEYGFVFDLDTTLKIRNEHSTMNLDRPERKQFVKNNGLFFVREDLIQL